MTGTCEICGKPTSGKLCRPHESQRKAIVAAEEARERDAETLRIMSEPGMNAARLGKRIGITRVAARHRILNAKRRTALLEEAAA